MTTDPGDGPLDDPAATDSDEPEEHDEPPDDSFLMGEAGVNEQVEAELARAEAELEGDAPESDDDGAVV